MKRYLYTTFILSTLLGFLSLNLSGQTPTIQDCLGAIPVCQESYTQTSVFTGYGAFNEIQDASGCPYSCMDGEKNSVWYIITCQSSGMMSFEINPVLPNDDYDWGVFNLTNAECGDIYGDPSIQVACNAAGILGNTGSWTAQGGNSDCEDWGNTNQWCADIPVQEGETYVICVSNWTQSNEGYTIDFSPSTANIYDNIKPEINWVQESFGCSGETEMNFSFSEFVLCSTVNAADFQLLDPDGIALTIIDVIGDACEDGGTQEVDFMLVLDPSTPIEKTGLHSLIINGPVSDLCDNYANFEAFDFMVITDAPYVDYGGLPANACLSDDPKSLVANRDEGIFSISPDCGDCLEDHGNGTATLYPSYMEAGTYGINYYYDDGICDNDTTMYILMNSLPETFDLNPGGSFCEGGEGIEIYLNGSENMVWYDLKRDGDYLESRLGTGGSLSFNYWTIPGTYTVAASSFCGVSTMTGTCTIEVIPAPMIFDISGPEYYCENSEGAIISVENSEAGVTYELLRNGVSLTPPLELPGIDAPLSFPPQHQEGTYSVYAHEDNCDNMMNGEVTVTERPAPEALFNYSGLCQWLPTNFTDASQIASGNITEYLWDFDDNGATSTEENPEYIFSDFGSFDVLLTVTSDYGCENQIVQQVTIAEGIFADAGEDEEINYGTFTTLSGTATGGSGNYTYHWEPEEMVLNPDAASTETVLMEADQTFTLTVHDSQSECYGESTATISVKGGPLRADPSANAEYVCYGTGAELHANAAGGNETYTYIWTSNPPGWNFSVGDPVIPSLTQSTMFYVVVDDLYSQIEDSVYVIVKDIPVIDAGDTIHIPHSYFTPLHCYTFGGGSAFSFEWSPEDKIDGDNHLREPKTISLVNDQRFDVLVANEFGCTETDHVWVELSGGPLAANPQASSNEICQFDTLHLYSGASGGGLPHRFEWRVIPGDGSIISTAENPIITVQDTGTFLYSVDVADQMNTISGSVQVTVHPTPVLNLAAPFDSIYNEDEKIVAVCIYDSVLLDACNTGFSYIWNNGDTAQCIEVGTTGIGSNIQEYYVKVFDKNTGCFANDTLRIIYSFAMCSYSIDDFNDQDLKITLYPNPFIDMLYIDIKGIKNKTEIRITDLSGKKNIFSAFIDRKNRWIKNINMNKISPGIYLFSVISGDQVYTRKVVKIM